MNTPDLSAFLTCHQNFNHLFSPAANFCQSLCPTPLETLFKIILNIYIYSLTEPTHHLSATTSTRFLMSSPFLLTFLLLLSLLLSSSASEIETHLHFYFHDIVVGSNRTAIRIAEASTTNSSTTFFGALVMIDDPLTENPDPGSKLIGRAQGMYALASQEEAELMMAMNFAFVDGELNGSTLSVLGRNAVMDGEREMPVIGGSGKFRFARGYAVAKTHQFDLVTGNAVVEYDVHVLHQ